MNNVLVVQTFQTINQLQEVLPYFLLTYTLFVSFAVFDLLKEVTSVTQLHDDAKSARVVVYERLFVRDNAGVSKKMRIGAYTYSIEARILTSLRAICLSFSDMPPILT